MRCFPRLPCTILFVGAAAFSGETRGVSKQKCSIFTFIHLEIIRLERRAVGDAGPVGTENDKAEIKKLQSEKAELKSKVRVQCTAV